MRESGARAETRRVLAIAFALNSIIDGHMRFISWIRGTEFRKGNSERTASADRSEVLYSQMFECGSPRKGRVYSSTTGDEG